MFENSSFTVSLQVLLADDLKFCLGSKVLDLFSLTLEVTIFT